MTASTQQITDQITALGFTVHNNGVPANTPVPYVALWGGVAAPDARALSGRARQAAALWQAVCVSNTHAGARIIAQAILDRLDGLRIAGQLVHCPFATAPQKDTTDPASVVWTVTIDIAQQGAR